ncbi:MAG: methylaspartate mutase subunit S [Chloroflexota bacterium]
MAETLVLGVVGADPHIIGNRILAYALEKAGFKVVNLGAMAEPEEFIKAAVETAARAILMGSLSGHGELYAKDFRKCCQEAGLDNILLYMGGHIHMGAQDWGEVEKRYKEMGFDRAYPPGVLPAQVIRDLKTDLGA